MRRAITPHGKFKIFDKVKRYRKTSLSH